MWISFYKHADVSNEEVSDNGGRDRSVSPTSTRGRGRGARVRRGQRLRFRGVPRGSRRGRQNRRQPRNADPELQWSRDAGIHNNNNSDSTDELVALDPKSTMI